ncbi:hypothetical protein UYO_0756 [Lachnospiraceae bacterium JC7]|nr:hypothetical protein UYO_0756 [Lachnospiraceae bacterium JC7]
MQKKQTRLSLKSILTFIMVFAMVLGAVPVPGSVMISRADNEDCPLKGKGDEESPYLITSSEDWGNFAELINGEQYIKYKDKSYKLANDITVVLDPKTGTSLYWDIWMWTVGSDPSRPFCGKFDGDHHTLTFKDYYSAQYMAPFMHVDGAEIRNLRVDGEISMVDSKMYIGGIVGQSKGEVTIQDCTSSISITGTEKNNIGCYHIGGIVGSADSGSVNIENCIFDGSLKTNSGESYGGAGFVGNMGKNASVNITDCLFAPKEIIHPYCDIFSFGYGATLTRAYRYWSDSRSGNDQGTRVYKEDEKPSDKILKKTQRSYDQGHYYWGVGEVSAEHLFEMKGSSMELPDFGVKFDGESLVKDKDCTVNVKDAVGNPVSRITSAGTYTLIVTGMGDYSGSTSTSFDVLGSLRGEGTKNSPYIISSDAEWRIFAARVNKGNSYKDKYVKLTSGIKITESAGDSDNKFSGTFLGGGNTLKLELNSETENCAPFNYLDGAAIENLTVSGSIETSSKYGASIAAHTSGDTKINNCHSTVSINGTVSGDAAHGGFVGVNESGRLTFKNCDFKGEISGNIDTGSCGGFVGGNAGKISYTNCLFAPSKLNIGEAGSCTFNCNASGDNTEFNGAYYVTALGKEQGIKVDEAAPADGNAVYSIIEASDGEKYYGLCDVEGLKKAYQLSDAPVHPEPEVKFAGTTLTKGTDYTVTWTETEAEAGKYSLTVQGVGKKYGGSLTIEYEVQKSGDMLGDHFFKINENGEYLIENADDLRALSAYVKLAKYYDSVETCDGKSFVQTADIDLENKPFNSIGDKQNFRGKYDGRNHTIRGMVVSGGMNDEGLFGLVYFGEVKNVRLLRPNVSNSHTSDDASAGGLVGRISASTVENCVVIDANVTLPKAKKGAIGGWVESRFTSTVNNCFFYDGSETALSGIGDGRGDVKRIYRVKLGKDLEAVASYTEADTDEFFIKGQDGSFFINSGDDEGCYYKAGSIVEIKMTQAFGRKLKKIICYDIDKKPLELEIKKISDDVYSFTMPEKDVTVEGVIDDLPDAGVSIKEGTRLEKTYGDNDFTLTAQVKKQGTNSKWTWESSDETVAKITTGSEGTTSVTILKASDKAVKITVSYASDSSAGKTELELKVNRMPVTVAGLSVSDKVYDGGTAATVTGTPAIKKYDIENSEVITGDENADSKLKEDAVSFSAGKANFVDKNAGKNKKVVFSGYSLSKNAVDNYVLYQPKSVNAEITQKEVKVSGIIAESKAYDGTTDAKLVYTKVSFDGICKGDKLEISGTGTFDSINVGKDKTVTISGLSLGGKDAGNYVLANEGQQDKTTASITRQGNIPDDLKEATCSIWAKEGKTATVSYTLPDGAVYGDVDNKNEEFFTVNSDDGLVLTASGSWTEEDWASDETKTFTVLVKDADIYEDYTLKVTVTPLFKPVGEFTFEKEEVTKTYGDEDFTISVNHSDGMGVLTYKSSDETVATVDDNGKVHILKASDSPLTITAIAEENDDYFDADASYKLTVDRKAVTVKADDITISEGEGVPELTATVKGLVGSDIVKYSLSREEGEKKGTYIITPEGEEVQGNYTVEYETGVLEITEKKLEIWTISYDSNGGNGTMKEQKVSDGSSVKLNANTFTRNNKSFSGWNTKADGSGEGYEDGAEISPGEDIKLYAQWKTTEKHKHHLELVERTEPGCETEGNKAYYKCTEDGCDKWFEDASGLVEITDKKSVIIDPLGHKWDRGKVTKEPTSTSTGIRTFTCLRDSSHTKTETIPKKQVSYYYDDEDSSDDSDDSGNSSGSTGGGNGGSGRRSGGTGGSGSGGSGSGILNSDTMVLGATRQISEKPESNTEELSDIGGTWKFINGVWVYIKSDGSMAQNKWMNLEYDGVRSWYFFGADGGMATGWITWNNQIYYLIPDSDGWMGRMATGWKYIDGKWYCFGKEHGNMLKGGKTPDGFLVGEDGVWDGKKKS